VRKHGICTTLSGLGVSDHVCWVYDDSREFVDAAVDFLADGLAAGQRLLYVTGRPVEQMRADLSGLRSAEWLLATGGLRVATVSDMVDLSQPIDPERQLAGLAAMTDQAVADGYTGLRIAADVTDIVAEAWRCPSQIVWEHQVEQYMGRGHPLAALCAYDRRAIPDQAVADVAVLHPLVHGPRALTARQLFFDGDRLVLTGEVDSFGCEQIQRLLARSHIGRGPHGGVAVTLDVAELSFIDARGLVTLARWGESLAGGGGRLVIEGVSPLMRRAWSALGFDRLTAVELGREAA
jgi:anti-anti-sigma regulatory factor